MRRQEIFESMDQTWRVNSAPFKRRRKELKLSLRSCATALSSHCTIETTRMRLWRCEKQSYFRVDAEMYAAIKKVLRV